MLDLTEEQLKALYERHAGMMSACDRMPAWSELSEQDKLEWAKSFESSDK